MTRESNWEYWRSKIQESIESIQYGSIHIVIHEGRIVQLERTERFRLDQEENIGKRKDGHRT